MKNLKKNVFLLILCMAANVRAQTVTYNHDDAKMNQFMVQEIGEGTLTPSLYYTLFHNSYKDSAARTNKLTSRGAAGVFAYTQISLAEDVDTALTKRAVVEAKNVADRTGGVLDLAWLAESSKVEDILNRYQKNINLIVQAGGTSDDVKGWQEYYNIYQFALKRTKEAYMPNSQRKQSYLGIYKDVNEQNELLLQYLVRLVNRKNVENMLSQHSTRMSSSAIGVKATQSLSAWRASALKTTKNEAGTGGIEATE